MTALVSDSIAPRRFSTTLLTVFAGIALALALTGICSVIAQSVAQRKLEIGIRMALGAGPKAIVAFTVQYALAPALIGMAVGLMGSLATTRLLGTMLFGVNPVDPGTWISVSVLMLAVALLASYVPARRARRIDPILALRAE